MKKMLTRRNFLRTTGVSVGTLVAGGGYTWRIEPGWIDITTHILHLPRLDPAFDGYHILQLSDIHMDDSWMDGNRLASIVNLVNQQQPDLIVITGDFVTLIDENTSDTFSKLKNLQARDGVLGVLGNHDHWTAPERVRDYLLANNIQELNDKTHSIQRGSAQLHIAGLDDLWTMRHSIPPLWSHVERLQQVLSPLPEIGAVILLVHEPDFADVAAANGRVDLQLSGHSHGGQVQLPFHGPLKLPFLARKYPIGMYQVDNMLHYTSRGIGMMKPQVRFNCRPEIAIFTCYSSSRQ